MLFGEYRKILLHQWLSLLKVLILYYVQIKLTSSAQPFSEEVSLDIEHYCTVSLFEQAYL